MKRDRTKEHAVRQHRRKTDSLFVAKEIFDKQRTRAKTHNYKTVEYTREEFLYWLFSTHYEELFESWVLSGNKKELKPSVDMIDASKGYSLCNVQVMTWAENNAKGKNENPTTKAVLQFTKDGEFIREWDSAISASRALAPHLKHHNKSKIYNVLNGHKHYNTFHGYRFQYKEGLQ